MVIFLSLKYTTFIFPYKAIMGYEPLCHTSDFLPRFYFYLSLVFPLVGAKSNPTRARGIIVYWSTYNLTSSSLIISEVVSQSLCLNLTKTYSLQSRFANLCLNVTSLTSSSLIISEVVSQNLCLNVTKRSGYTVQYCAQWLNCIVYPPQNLLRAILHQ